MRTDRIELEKFIEQHLATADVSDLYAVHLRLTRRLIERWAGRTVFVDELSADLLNPWLIHEKGRGLSPFSIATYRGNILNVWNLAIMAGVNDHSPLRLRRIKRPAVIVRAYTHAELNLLLTAASRNRGRDTYGNKRSDWWRKLIHAAYSTGLRRGDLLRVFEADIAADGTYHTVQGKTGKPVTVRFSPETLAIKLRSPNGLLLPWPHRLDSLVHGFRRLRKRAGVLRGSLKWHRRAAGSYAERDQPGAGARLLGNSPQVFRLNYADLGIIGETPISPPPLATSKIPSPG